MKQTILFFALIAAALLSACDKDDDNNGSITGYWFSNERDDGALLYFNTQGIVWADGEINKDEVPLTAWMEKGGTYQRNGNDYIITVENDDYVYTHDPETGYVTENSVRLHCTWTYQIICTLHGDKLNIKEIPLTREDITGFTYTYDPAADRYVDLVEVKPVPQIVYDEIMGLNLGPDGYRSEPLTTFERFPDAEKIYKFKYAWPEDPDEEWHDERPSDY